MKKLIAIFSDMWNKKIDLIREKQKEIADTGINSCNKI
jgi:hypothetical protein